MSTRINWLPEEVEKLRIWYADTEMYILENIFKKSSNSISYKASSIGLKKSPEFLSRVFGETLKRVGASTRFTKGSVSHNKGKKRTEFMSEQSIARCEKTQFKKGNKPANMVPIGYERVTKDDYIEVKIGDFEDSTENFKLKHRILYEEINGPIPEGYQVRFIDGDKRNFEPSNFKLVSFKESLKVNSMCDTSIVKRFLGVRDLDEVEKILTNHYDLVNLKRQTIQLNQTINGKSITAAQS